MPIDKIIKKCTHKMLMDKNVTYEGLVLHLLKDIYDQQLVRQGIKEIGEEYAIYLESIIKANNESVGLSATFIIETLLDKVKDELSATGEIKDSFPYGISAVRYVANNKILQFEDRDLDIVRQICKKIERLQCSGVEMTALVELYGGKKWH